MLLSLALSLLVFFNGCERNELENETTEELSAKVETDILLENDYLVFSDFESADSVLNLLLNAGYETQLGWEEMLGFVSAKTYRKQICEEMDAISDSIGMLNYVTELAKTGYFNWSDSSVTYPFYNYSWSAILNPDGKVKIGENLYYFDENSQLIVLGGNESRITEFKSGTLDGSEEDVLVYTQARLKMAGYDFGAELKSERKYNGSKKRLTVKLYYQPVTYVYPDYVVEKVYYQLYYHQEKKSWGSWRDNHTYFHYYPESLQVGEDTGTPSEWGDPFVGSESKEWHTLNSSELSNVYQILWTSGTLDGYAEKDGSYAVPVIIMDYGIYSDNVGSETSCISYVITAND